MSIVHTLPEVPKEGSVVYANNGRFASDRAIFRDGKFLGGGEFPTPQYPMSQVSKWFYMDEYSEKMKPERSYVVSFDQAEKL